MTSMQVASRGRVITLTLTGATIRPRWWIAVRVRRRNRQRRPDRPAPQIPDRVHIPAKAVRKVAFTPARSWWPGKVTIHAPGYGDPWTWRAQFHRKGHCPHRIRFGRRKEWPLMEIARIIDASL